MTATLFVSPYLFITFICFIANCHHISHECSTDEMERKHIRENPNLLRYKNEFDAKWKQIVSKTGGHTNKWNRLHNVSINNYIYDGNMDDESNGNIDIPVIFHILYDSDSDTPQDVVEYSTFIDRINHINLYYNAKNADITTYRRWQNIIGNMDMTFFINKIIYYDVGSNSPYLWGSPQIKASTYGASPVDAEHNLNIWFVRPSSGSPSAYSTFPWDSDIGIVFNIGLINGDFEHYEWGAYHSIYGREIGHWVGLYHIWGWSNMTDQGSISCSEDDFVVDTPNMGNTWDNKCPSNPVNSCKGGAPDMFENFMSYSSCSNMFTDGQVLKARTNFMEINGLRHSFVDYKHNSAATEFVNMFYFTNNECMIGDTKKNIAIGIGNTYLCVSYSNNPYIDVYEEIEFVTDYKQCSSNDDEYQSMDTNLNGYYVCYKKVQQIYPMSKATIIDIDIKLNPSYSNNYYSDDYITSDQYKLILINLHSNNRKKKYFAYRTLSSINSCEIQVPSKNMRYSGFYNFVSDLTPYNDHSVYYNDINGKYIYYDMSNSRYIISNSLTTIESDDIYCDKDNIVDCNSLNTFYCKYKIETDDFNNYIYLYKNKKFNNKYVYTTDGRKRFISWSGDTASGWVLSYDFPATQYIAYCTKGNLFECVWFQNADVSTSSYYIDGYYAKYINQSALIFMVFIILILFITFKCYTNGKKDALLGDKYKGYTTFAEVV